MLYGGWARGAWPPSAGLGVRFGDSWKQVYVGLSVKRKRNNESKGEVADMAAAGYFEDESRDELLQEAQIFSFLEKVFLTLPDERFLSGVKQLDWANAESDGCSDIAEYLTSHDAMPANEVILDLGRDRARLMRGMGLDAIEPPYESLYTKGQVNTSIGALNRFYSQAGYAVGKSVRDTSDHIGVEFAFMALMCTKQAEAMQAGDAEVAAGFRATREKFATQHLGRWKDAYADAMEQAAKTGFYRGIAKMVRAVPLA